MVRDIFKRAAEATLGNLQRQPDNTKLEDQLALIIKHINDLLKTSNTEVLTPVSQQLETVIAPQINDEKIKKQLINIIKYLNSIIKSQNQQITTQMPSAEFNPQELLAILKLLEKNTQSDSTKKDLQKVINYLEKNIGTKIPKLKDNYTEKELQSILDLLEKRLMQTGIETELQYIVKLLEKIIAAPSIKKDVGIKNELLTIVNILEKTIKSNGIEKEIISLLGLIEKQLKMGPSDSFSTQLQPVLNALGSQLAKLKSSFGVSIGSLFKDRGVLTAVSNFAGQITNSFSSLLEWFMGLEFFKMFFRVSDRRVVIIDKMIYPSLIHPDRKELTNVVINVHKQGDTIGDNLNAVDELIARIKLASLVAQGDDKKKIDKKRTFTTREKIELKRVSDDDDLKPK